MSHTTEALSPRPALARLWRRIFTRTMWIVVGLALAIGYMIGGDLARRTNAEDPGQTQPTQAESRRP